MDVERLDMEAQKDRDNQQAFGDDVVDVGHWAILRIHLLVSLM
jgi:hypothetical protein